METDEGWRPGLDMTDHAGIALSDTLSFPHRPPAEIGEIITADSTLRHGKIPIPPATRQMMILLPAVLGFLGVRFLMRNYLADDSISDSLWPPSIAAVLIAAIALYATRFRYSMTYVGQYGIAQYDQKGDLKRFPKIQILVFDSATDLRISQTPVHVQGVYLQTSFKFVWTNAAGKTVMKLAGDYRDKKGKPPKPKNPIHFARCAEIAWSAHLLTRLESQLEQGAAIEFNISRGKSVSVGPGFMEFHVGGEHARMEVDDIRDINVGGDVFRVVHKDAKWFGRRGKFNFTFAQIANVRVFLIVIQRLLGFAFD